MFGRTNRKKKAEKETEKKGIKAMELITESLGLPKDTVLGAALVRSIGNRELYVENFRSIIEYTERKVRLQTKTCKLTIEGKCLFIEYYNCEEIKITGYIMAIQYE